MKVGPEVRKGRQTWEASAGQEQAASLPPPEPVLPPPVVRELKPGEVSLEDLEAAFMSAPGPDESDFLARSAGGLATPEQWAACPRPHLTLLSQDGGFAVLRVSRE